VNARLPSRSSSSDGQFEFFITSTTSQWFKAESNPIWY
jgi:hypothetical protein